MRTLLALAALLAVGAGLLFAVTAWPVDDDSRPVRAGYYRALSPDVVAALRDGNVELAAVPQDQPIRGLVLSHAVDVLLVEDAGSITVQYVREDRASVRAAEWIETLIQRYNRGRVAQALQVAGATPRPFPGELLEWQPIYGEAPQSWHLFFGALLPSLLVAALTLGIALAGGGRRRRIARGELFVLAVALELYVLLQSVEFHTTTSLSAAFSPEALFVPLLPALAVILAFVPAISIAAAIGASGRRRVYLAIAVVAVAMFAMAIAHLLDAPDGAPVSSQVPYAVTLPTLVACAIASFLLDRRASAARSGPAREGRSAQRPSAFR